MRSSIFTKSANLFAPIFRIAWARWIFTVTLLKPSLAAICLFESPAATRATTSRSRALSDEGASASVNALFVVRFAVGGNPGALVLGEVKTAWCEVNALHCGDAGRQSRREPSKRRVQGHIL
jgi:hypothetical protein